MKNRNENEKKSKIVLKRYYKDCISVKNPNWEVTAYVKKTGFCYTLGSENALHISDIAGFLERCEVDKMKVEFVGFKEEDYI
jgi:hypothetical protein